MKERNEVIACFALFKLNTTIKSGVVRVVFNEMNTRPLFLVSFHYKQTTHGYT